MGTAEALEARKAPTAKMAADTAATPRSRLVLVPAFICLPSIATDPAARHAPTSADKPACHRTVGRVRLDGHSEHPALCVRSSTYPQHDPGYPMPSRERFSTGSAEQAHVPIGYRVRGEGRHDRAGGEERS